MVFSFLNQNTHRASSWYFFPLAAKLKLSYSTTMEKKLIFNSKDIKGKKPNQTRAKQWPDEGPIQFLVCLRKSFPIYLGFWNVWAHVDKTIKPCQHIQWNEVKIMKHIKIITGTQSWPQVADDTRNAKYRSWHLLNKVRSWNAGRIAVLKGNMTKNYFPCWKTLFHSHTG